MTRFLWLPLLIVANFSLAGLGLYLPFAAIQADSGAPWTDDVQTFMAKLTMAVISGTLFCAVLALVLYARGHPAYLAAVSMAALVLPAVSARTYYWYLGTVDGTIGGAVGFQLGAATLLIAAAGALEAAIAGSMYASRRAGRTYP